MSVASAAEIIKIATVADLAYSENEADFQPADFPGYELQNNTVIDGSFGFQAWSFFNETTNDLVIAFSGTEGLNENDWADFIPDKVNNASLALTGMAPQVASAKDFIDSSINETGVQQCGQCRRCGR